MTTTVNVSLVNAETNDFIDSFEHEGAQVHFSVGVFPVSSQIADIGSALDALATESGNGPVPLGGPADKPVVGAPGAGALFSALTETARIYKVPGSLTLQLYPTTETVGWYIAAVPLETGDFDVEPSYFYVKKADGDASAPFTFYSKELSARAKAVLQIRKKTRIQRDLLESQWGGKSLAVWKMVYNYIWNVIGPPPDDEDFAKLWPDIIWPIMDESVPAREFDLLVERWLQMRGVLETVPWPDIPFFERCCLGLPFTIGKDGEPLSVGDYRLFMPSYSDYFPKSDKQIATDLGTLWLANFGAIVDCIIEKIAERAKDAERTAKFWAYAGLIAPVLIFPTPAAILDVIKTLDVIFLKNANPLLLQAINLGLDVVFSVLNPGGFAAAGFDIGVKAYDYLKGKFSEKLAAIGQQDIDALLAAVDPDEIKQLTLATFGLDTFPKDMEPWLIWCMRVTGIDILAAQLLNDVLEEEKIDPQKDISGALLADAQAAGVDTPDSLVALVNGENSDFPAQAPGVSAVTVVAVAGGGAGAIVLGYLAIAGKLF